MIKRVVQNTFPNGEYYRGENSPLKFIDNLIAVFQILSLAQPDKEEAAGSTRCRGGYAESAAGRGAVKRDLSLAPRRLTYQKSDKPGV